MSDEEHKPQANRKKIRWSDKPKLAPDAASRQGRVTRLAIDALGDLKAAVNFLNTDCGKLGGRPLDLAVGSAEGFGRVEQALANIRLDPDPNTL